MVPVPYRPDSAMDNKSFSQTISAMTKQMDYMKVNGFPGLCSDIAGMLESNTFLQWNENSLQALSESDIECLCEELIITLPYAGTNFTINLYFNLHEPWIPPDMIFSDLQFMRKVTVKTLEDMVPCLSSWNYLKEDMVGQLLIQLHMLYKKYQLECLESEELLQFEYQSLLESLRVGEGDVEISLTGGSNWFVSFMIRLPINLKDVPPALIESNPGPPSCLLHITIKKSSGTFTPKLHLSHQVEALIGGSKTLGLPSVPPNSSLCDYITNVLHLIEEKIKQTVLAFEMRKQLIAQLLCHFGSALIEYDADKFSKATLLLDWKDFHFLLLITVPENFPKANPYLTLRSVYHCNSRGPFILDITDLRLPQHPSSEDVVRAIKNSVIQAVPSFQSYSISGAK